jgi:mRNA m6A methyltransferase non-catalytic subunit
LTVFLLPKEVSGSKSRFMLDHVVHARRSGMIRTTETLSSANDLLSGHNALIARVRASQQHHRRRLCALHSPPDRLVDLDIIPSPCLSPSPSPPSSPLSPSKPKHLRPDLPPAKRARVTKYHNYVPEEETIRNDYSQRYVDGGEWPQNWVMGAEPEHRFEEWVLSTLCALFIC